MNGSVEFQGFQCICGEWVAVYHQECLALLTDEQKRERRFYGLTIRDTEDDKGGK